MARKAAEMTRSTTPRAATPGSTPPRVRERMPGRVAHDLLGIVAVVQGYAELVPMEPSKTLQQEYCHRILRACRRMVEMVDRSLALSKRESGAVVLVRRTVELAPFLGECLAAQMLKARRKDMVLSLEMDAGLSTVSVDPGCMESVLSNLLENAIKFSHQGSAIKLVARLVADALEIEVQDAGQGIPEKDLATLFDPYRTGSSRPTGGERSTGLGLSIVKELVHAHHGVVGVRSEVGRGSTFSVRLPLDGLDLPAAPALDRRGAGESAGPGFVPLPWSARE